MGDYDVARWREQKIQPPREHTRLVAELIVGNIFNLHPVIHLVPA